MKQPNEKALYVIDFSPHGSNHQLALHIIIRDSPGELGTPELCFYDTDRGHMIRGKMKSTHLSKTTTSI